MEFILMESCHTEQIASLEKMCFSSPWSLQSIAAELNNPLSLWVVAVDEQKVTGYIGSQSVMGEADMMNLAVSPQYRCQGIGKKLVLELINKLRENGVYMLTLEVRASNTVAVKLYSSLGFFEVGRRPGYYTKPKEDALILRKEWHS